MASLAELGVSLGGKVRVPSPDGSLRKVEIVQVQAPEKMHCSDGSSSEQTSEHITSGRIYVTPPPDNVERHFVYYSNSKTIRVFDTHASYEVRPPCKDEILVDVLSFNFDKFQKISILDSLFGRLLPKREGVELDIGV